VMIARGATRNPWLFAQIAARLAGDVAPEPTVDDRRRLIVDHFARVLDRESERRALYKLKKFTGIYSYGLPDGVSLRRRIEGFSRAEDLFSAVAGFLDEAVARQAA